MDAVSPRPSIRCYRTARVWLPLTISVALHALFVTGALILSSGEGAQAGGPIPADLVALDDRDGISILDDPASGPKPSRAATQPAKAPDDEESSQAINEVVVGELPVVASRVGLSSSPGPASLGSGGTTGDGGAGSSLGLLRPPAKARSVAFVIDRSLSMGLSGALTIARRELLAGLDALSPDTRFAVILYNRQVEPLRADGQSGLLAATEANRQTVARLVESVRAEGGTDHAAALRRAIELRVDVIFLVTDADELTADQVRILARLNHGRTSIHTIEISNDAQARDETPLKLLARLTGGKHRLVPIPRY